MSLADTEVRWHQKRIDLAVETVRDDIGVMAIELKVNSTGRAIQQAALNKLLTPSSWVATWAMPSAGVLDRAKANGIGVLLVTDAGAYPVLHPASGAPRTTALFDHIKQRRRRVRDLLSEIRNV